MQVVILCGGKGTRAYPHTTYLPKPMMLVAGRPILLHVMQMYANHGHCEFVLALGYLKEAIMDYFDRKSLDWDVQLVDTGDESQTGERIRRCKHLLRDRFMATYSDGLSDVDLNELARFHESHGGLATLTSTPLVSQYGTVEMEPEDGRIVSFQEKPVLPNYWINAGFFVFEKEVFDHWEGQNLEQEVFPSLAAKNLLHAYKHAGFFKSMDTLKDQEEIEKCCQGGRPRWQREDVAASRVVQGGEK